MCDSPKRSKERSFGDCSDATGQDDSLHRCVACKTLLSGEDSAEHPWLYGFSCSDCISFCINILFNETTPDAFQVRSFGMKDLENRCKNFGFYLLFSLDFMYNCFHTKCAVCESGKGLTLHNSRLLCFDCAGREGIHTAPKPRHDWIERVFTFQLRSGNFLKQRKPLRVLSLFDGIGTGLLVLDALGLEVQDYFSCEIDDAAVSVSEHHFHGRIKHLGSVSNLTIAKLRSLGQIDLLLGGSPCNQLSLANPHRKGLFDPVDTGVLFFDFNRILKFLQSVAMSNTKPFFWLYENVASMPHMYRDTISKTLQCKPATWDSIQFLPVQRARLFWGNIPELHGKQNPDCPPVHIIKILEPYRKAVVDSLPTLTTTFHSQSSGKEMQLPVLEDGNEVGLLITERERLFGFPTHYTDGPNLSIHKRQQLLGKAWSVPVIEKILSPLTKIFKVKGGVN